MIAELEIIDQLNSNKNIEDNILLIDKIIKEITPIIDIEYKDKEKEIIKEKEKLSNKIKESKNLLKNLKAEQYMFNYEEIKYKILNNIWTIIRWGNNEISDKLKNNIITLVNSINDYDVGILKKQNLLLVKHINKNMKGEKTYV
jgi:hypothetical protein